MIVLSGCPASGKSTLIEFLKSNYIMSIFQFDTIQDTYSILTPETYHQIRISLVQSVEDFLKQGENEIAIIEDTNHLKSLVKPFRRLAKAYNAKFLHFVIKIPAETALQRNSNRENPLNPETIIKISKQIDSETFFKDTIVINGLSEYLNSGLYDRISSAQRFDTSNYADSKNTQNRQTNFIKFADTEMRRTINSLIASYEGDKKDYAAVLIKQKKSLMKGIKNIKNEDYHKFSLEVNKIFGCNLNLI